MNELELRDKLREVIATSEPPAAMNATAMLDTARAAHRRRRAALAGGGAAAAVVAIAVGATVALGPGLQQLPLGGALWGPNTAETKPAWPTGPDGQPQSDRTSYAGPHHDVGVRLLDELVAAVPQGYTVPQSAPDPLSTTAEPEDLSPSNDPWIRYQQAQFADRVDGVEVWEYLASLAVHQGEDVGRLYVQVHTPRNDLPAEPCALAGTLWGLGSEGCEVVDVGGKAVGVVLQTTSTRGEFDQWAAYRHTDDTVVIVAQAQRFRGASSGLAQPLFTPQQLAELAVAERFRLA